jgi:hypothetical protein
MSLVNVLNVKTKNIVSGKEQEVEKCHVRTSIISERGKNEMLKDINKVALCRFLVLISHRRFDIIDKDRMSVIFKHYCRVNNYIKFDRKQRIFVLSNKAKRLLNKRKRYSYVSESV